MGQAPWFAVRYNSMSDIRAGKWQCMHVVHSDNIMRFPVTMQNGIWLRQAPHWRSDSGPKVWHQQHSTIASAGSSLLSGFLTCTQTTCQSDLLRMCYERYRNVLIQLVYHYIFVLRLDAWTSWIACMYSGVDVALSPDYLPFIPLQYSSSTQYHCSTSLCHSTTCLSW